jgi:hypothetical protein
VPKTVPTAPTACTAYGWEGNYKWVSFSWQPPLSNGGAQIIKYLIYVYRNDIYQGSMTSPSTVQPLHNVIQVFYSGNYDVYIYAANSAGWGPACHTTTSVPVP